MPNLLSKNFEQLDTSAASICGHSMGGHGALTIFFKNSDKYKVCVKCWLYMNHWLQSLNTFFNVVFNFFMLQSVSAFSPISNPVNCGWGQKAFENYLGSNKADWEVCYNHSSLPFLLSSLLQNNIIFLFYFNTDSLNSPEYLKFFNPDYKVDMTVFLFYMRTYFHDNKSKMQEYDATILAKKATASSFVTPILIDQVWWW